MDGALIKFTDGTHRCYEPRDQERNANYGSRNSIQRLIL